MSKIDRYSDLIDTQSADWPSFELIERESLIAQYIRCVREVGALRPDWTLDRVLRQAVEDLSGLHPEMSPHFVIENVGSGFEGPQGEVAQFLAGHMVA